MQLVLNDQLRRKEPTGGHRIADLPRADLVPVSFRQMAVCGAVTIAKTEKCASLTLEGEARKFVDGSDDQGRACSIDLIIDYHYGKSLSPRIDGAEFALGVLAPNSSSHRCRVGDVGVTLRRAFVAFVDKHSPAAWARDELNGAAIL